MNFKELIAGLLSVLITGATFAFAVSAATTLDQYPGFLWSNGQFNAYIVLGSGNPTNPDAAGLASDIASAIDIAVRLAEQQYTKTTVTGGTTTNVDGIERDLSTAGAQSIALTATGGLPGTLRDFNFDGLQTGTVNYQGSDYDYHEAVILGNGVKLDHTFSTSNINGTQKLTINTNGQIEYRYYFDKDITNAGL